MNQEHREQATPNRSQLTVCPFVVYTGDMKRALIIIALVLGVWGCSAIFNTPPTARFSCSTTEGDAPLTVAFNASSSSDTDGYIRVYRWSFGDGHTGYGVNTTHTYTAPGTYSAQLYIEDDDSAKDTCWTTIQVHESNPDSWFPPTNEGFWDFVWYCQRNWEYESDLPGELCQDPTTSYLRMRGDCDDFAVMIAGFTQEYFGFDSEVYQLDFVAGGPGHAVAGVHTSYDVVSWYYSPCLFSPGPYARHGDYPYWIYLPIDTVRCVPYGKDDVVLLTWCEWYEMVGQPLSLLPGKRDRRTPMSLETLR